MSYGLEFSNLVLFRELHWVNRRLFSFSFFFFWPSSTSCNSFSMLFNTSAFLLYSLRTDFLFKYFWFPLYMVDDMTSDILPLLAGRHVLECPILSLTFDQYLFSPSFVSIFYFISLSCIIYFDCCVALLFLSKRIPVLFLSLDCSTWSVPYNAEC